MNTKGTSYLDCQTDAHSPVLSRRCGGLGWHVVNPVVIIRSTIPEGFVWRE